MVYSTLAAVKNFLPEIASGDTSFDPELTDLQTNANYEINRIIKRYTNLPIQNTNITGELAYIEAEWVAGVFRNRRPPVSNADQANARIKDMEAHAKQRLTELLDSEYWGRTQFVNTQRQITGNDFAAPGWFLH